MKFILLVLIIGFLLYTGLMGWLVRLFGLALEHIGYAIFTVGRML